MNGCNCCEQITNIEALIEQARKISPSASMSIYLSDLERALGRDVPRAHKLGRERPAP